VSVQSYDYFGATNGARPATGRAASATFDWDFMEITMPIGGFNARLMARRLPAGRTKKLEKSSWLTLEVAFAGQSNWKSPDRRRRWAIAIAGLVVRGPARP
jgi:hypothetical protein